MKTNEKKAQELCDIRHCISLSCEQCRFVTAINMAKWKDQIACDIYRNEVKQFCRILVRLNKDYDGLIDIEASVADFRKKISHDLAEVEE